MVYAAPRYTEVKLDDICVEIFADIDKNTVDFIDNYDGTMKEPTLLPAKFPNILVNPNQGIAVGMASNLCSFNLKEVCETTVAYLKNPDCDILKTLIAPDFSTGGELIYDENEIRQIYETGRGNIKIRAKYTYDPKNNCIDITQIPYTTTIEAIIDKIAELMKQGKVKEISDIRDETDLHGLKITIDLKRGTDADKLMARLYKLTPLMDNFSCNFNVLIENVPKVMGVKELLLEWTRFRVNCIKRSLAFDIDKKNERLHLLLGLEKILLDIDKAIRIIRETEHESEVISNLMDGFDIDESQAEFIAEIKLRNINKEYIIKRTQDIENLIDEIATLRSTLGDENKIKDLICSELKAISKNTACPEEQPSYRPTKLKNSRKNNTLRITLFAFLTRDGYLKKIPLTSLRAASDQKLKEGDELIFSTEATNKSEILVFTDKCTVYKVKTYEISDCKASQLGEYLPTALKMDEYENVKGIAVTTDYSGYMLFCFKNGKMAKISLSSYETKQNRKKLTNAYAGSSPLVKMFQLTQDLELAAISSIDKVLVFNTSSISVKATRDSQGVNVLTLKVGCTKDVIKAAKPVLKI